MIPDLSPDVSITRTFGVGAWRYASTAAGPPPIWILTWAFCMRRSPAAASITSATGLVSQKAWIVTRGTGAITRSWLPVPSDIAARLRHGSVPDRLIDLGAFLAVRG